jgi:hypothetical protein
MAFSAAGQGGQRSEKKGKSMKLLARAFVVILAGGLVGCGGLTKGKGAAEKAIARFHEQYNEGKLDDIWKEADPRFRAGAPREAYEQFMSALQRKLGKVTSTANAAWNVKSYNFNTTIAMTQTTVFEKGEGTESFTFAMDGTNAVLVGYKIDSMDLITR